MSEKLKEKATNIKWIEDRIQELSEALKKDLSVGKRLSLQESLRVNRIIREQLLAGYWDEESK